MIFTERKITISNNASSINKQIVLYRGDKNVEIRFTISEFPFKYSRNNETNVIESTEASFGQLVIKVPNDKAPIFSDIVPTKKGSVVFTITGEMIDEISELGTYDFQIRLFDEEQNSRATIPPIEKGIEIREPIATEVVSNTNEVGVAVANYAVTTTATALDAFDENGNYIKTTWSGGDVITSAKLNKIEAGIDGVNQKIASGGTGGQGMTEEQAQQLNTAYTHSQSTHVQQSDIPTKTSDLNNDSNFVNETYVTNAINNAQLGGGGNLINQNGGGALKIWTGTKAEFDALTITEDDVIYLVEGLNSETTITYNVTNELTNCTNNNSNSTVDEQSSYSATIIAIDGYILSNVVITMGGIDVTSSVYADGIITIPSVTGDIVITATAVEDTQNSDTFTLSTVVPTNMLNGNTGNGHIDTSGNIAINNNNIYWGDYFEIDALAKYCFITDSTNYYLAEYDESKTFIQRYKNISGYVPSSNAKYIRVAIQNTVTTSTYLYKIDNVIEMELGGISQNNGSLLTSTRESRSVKFILGINALSDITLKTNAYFKVRFYDISQNFISTTYSNALQNSSVTIPDNAYSMKLIIDGNPSAGIEITEELMNTYFININGIPYSFLLGV